MIKPHRIKFLQKYFFDNLVISNGKRIIAQNHKKMTYDIRELWGHN